MAGTPIPWPVSARPYDSHGSNGESQGDLLNVYAMKAGDQVQWKRVPGLARFTPFRNDPSSRNPRGQLAVDNYIISAWDEGLEATTAAGTVVPIAGNVAGERPVYMARNMRTVPQIAIVAEGGAYLASTDTLSVGAYPLSNINGQMVNNLGFVNSVDYYAGYFVFSRPDGTIVCSDLQNAQIPDLSWDKADTTADGLLRILNNGDTVLAMGQRTIEVWQDVGKSPFPLARATVLPVGLLAQNAVAGGPGVWERGVLFVANDFTVRQLDGYTPTIVSNDAVSRDLYAARFQPERLRAQVYAFNGHAIWSLSHDAWTWEYNLNTGSWHRRESYGHGRFRGLFATNFANRWLVQDEVRDGLLEIDAAVYHEDGTRLVAQLTSAALKDFPVSVRVPVLYFDFETGLGDVQAAGREGSDPVAMLSWSHDGGLVYSNPLARSLGRQGQRSALIALRNTGRSTHRGITLRWTITDPVDITFRAAVAPTTNPSRPRQVKA